MSSLARLLVLMALAAACRGPRIAAEGPHEAMAPGSPDQMCLLCHRAGTDDAPMRPHEDEADREGCTRCHGPQSPAMPRMLMETR